MNGQPTPGPWMFEEQWHGTAIKTEDGAETVARVSPRSDFAKEIATARLIAAAPELLEAAKEILAAGFDDRMASRDSVIYAEGLLRSAIAKATEGRE